MVARMPSASKGFSTSGARGSSRGWLVLLPDLGHFFTGVADLVRVLTGMLVPEDSQGSVVPRGRGMGIQGPGRPPQCLLLARGQADWPVPDVRRRCLPERAITDGG